MKNLKTIALMSALCALTATPAFAEGRPSGSQRPPNAPQRPAASYGVRGQRPAGAPQRPAASYGQSSQRPVDAPTRPGRP